MVIAYVDQCICESLNMVVNVRYTEGTPHLQPLLLSALNPDTQAGRKWKRMSVFVSVARGRILLSNADPGIVWAAAPDRVAARRLVGLARRKAVPGISMLAAHLLAVRRDLAQSL